MENSLWIALLALSISALGPTFFALIKWSEVRGERHERRLQWRRDFLKTTLDELIELRASLQYLQDKDPEAADRYQEIPLPMLVQLRQEREVAYGKAFAHMLKIPKSRVRGNAGQVMDQVENWDQNEKLAAINQAIIALGDMLDEAMGDGERVSKL